MDDFNICNDGSAWICLAWSGLVRVVIMGKATMGGTRCADYATESILLAIEGYLH